MSRAPAAIALAAVLAVLLVTLALNDPRAESSIGTGNDCRTWTGTPSGTGTPWPSPPFTPYETLNICNDTGFSANDLHVKLVREASNYFPVTVVPPGCEQPYYVFNSPSNYTEVDISWADDCVDPGETVSLHFVAGCSTPEQGCLPPYVACFYWTFNGAQLPSVSPAVNPATCETATPTVTPSPVDCPARPTPPVTYEPTPFNPPPTPYNTSRDVIIEATIPFCNNSGQDASDLHIHFAFPFSNKSILQNPPGCPAPIVAAENEPDAFDLDIDWRTDCVDPGESLTFRFTYLCGDTPCVYPHEFCYTWTLYGDPLDSEGECPGLPGVQVRWGDINCDGVVGILDARRTLQGIALDEGDPPGCLGVDDAGPAGEEPLWGDVNCDGQIDGADALALLVFAAGLPPTQFDPCPEIGEPLVS